MNTIYSQQVHFKELVAQPFDVLIASSGYEPRATYISKSIFTNADQKICLGFDKHLDKGNRKENDNFFHKNGFRLMRASGDSTKEIHKILFEILSLGKEELNIAVDYSCMTRVWYGHILESLFHFNLIKKVNVFFCYSQSKFIAPPDLEVYHNDVSPIEGFYTISTPIKPVALIISLGYIKQQAFSLSEFFDAERYLFINKVGVTDTYYDTVKETNREIIHSTPKENIFNFSLNNIVFTETILEHLCRDLVSDHKVIIAPCGPKPFTLISFLLSLKLGFVDVWRISFGKNDLTLPYEANGEVITYKISFEPTEATRGTQE